MDIELLIFLASIGIMAASGIARFNAKLKLLEYRLDDLDTEMCIYRNHQVKIPGKTECM
jgi:hypothetical protein